MTRWPVDPLTFSKKNPSRAIPRSTYIHPPSLAKIGQRTSEEIGNKQTDRQTDKRCSIYSMILHCTTQDPFKKCNPNPFTTFWVMLSTNKQTDDTKNITSFAKEVMKHKIKNRKIKWKIRFCILQPVCDFTRPFSQQMLFIQCPKFLNYLLPVVHPWQNEVTGIFLVALVCLSVSEQHYSKSHY